MELHTLNAVTVSNSSLFRLSLFVLISNNFLLGLFVSGVMYTEVRRPGRVMIFVNPQSGRGQALQLFTGHVQGMLTEAAVPYKLFITGQLTTVEKRLCLACYLCITSQTGPRSLWYQTAKHGIKLSVPSQCNNVQMMRFWTQEMPKQVCQTCTVDIMFYATSRG